MSSIKDFLKNQPDFFSYEKNIDASNKNLPEISLHEKCVKHKEVKKLTIQTMELSLAGSIALFVGVTVFSIGILAYCYGLASAPIREVVYPFILPGLLLITVGLIGFIKACFIARKSMTISKLLASYDVNELKRSTQSIPLQQLSHSFVAKIVCNKFVIDGLNSLYHEVHFQRMTDLLNQENDFEKRLSKGILYAKDALSMTTEQLTIKWEKGRGDYSPRS